MKKFVITIIAAALLSASTAVPALADRWEGHYHDGGLPGGPLWPIVAALSIPAAVIDTATRIAFPFPGIGYPATQVTTGTGSYTGPADFTPTAYAGPAEYEPAPYYAPRAYVAPRGYHESRGHYRERGYRIHRGGW